VAALSDPAPEWTPVQQAVLADLERMEKRQIGYFKTDDYPADRCKCDHLVTGPGPGCPVSGCACGRHESRNRPLRTEGGETA